MPEREADPALYRRRLRSEIRKAREAAGLSHKQVAAEMDWSPSKLSRIEAGTVTMSTNDLRVLLALYKITDQAKVNELIDSARRARERSPWWHRYRDVASPELLALIGYETSAKVLRNFEPLGIPGLLQTEEYARELFRFIRGSKDRKRIDSLVMLRMHRQELLAVQDGRDQHFIIDEAAIRRMVGGPGVMRRQLIQLQELMAKPNVTIGILPFDHGMYRGLRVPYVVYEFDDPQDGTILYLENPDGELVISEDVELPEGDEGTPNPSIYLEVFFELEHTTSEADTVAIIDDAIAMTERSPTWRVRQLDVRAHRGSEPPTIDVTADTESAV